MFNIMDFPDEVLVQIAYETLPDGIKALSQCSKRFSLVSKNALIQHEAYKKKYRDIQVNKKEGAGLFLTEVVRNPRCAEYVRHADFEKCCEDVRVPLNDGDTEDQNTLTGRYVGRYCTRYASFYHHQTPRASTNMRSITYGEGRMTSPWLSHATARAVSRRSRLR